MLNHLRFADDTALLAHTPQEAERIVRQLDEVGKKVGLQLNAKKTKVMRNGFADPSAVRLGQTTLEDTDEYVYLGRSTNDLKPEILGGREVRGPRTTPLSPLCLKSRTRN
ncbi:hypothetical protein ANCCEY_10035 [Ancylostoma ceylanicum]|uniref:Reverse transcriptase domain-containing protein n=1 Tax=Ancylostoma ceylanicum TaxID=53326 RepID=A0A0D6LTA0_9BILA|nr:hypothetical protein ANCCEY_10035 [Ancylostoma ceylanicum]